MAYDPQIHIPIDKPIAMAQGAPDGARSYFYDASLLIYRPFQSTVEVNTYINRTKWRKGNFSIFICTGALQLDGSFVGGQVNEYWYRNGTTNGHLVEKLPTVTTDLSRLKRYPYRITGAPVASLQNPEWIGATLLSGSRSGGEIFLDDDPDFVGWPDAWNFNTGTGTLTPPTTLQPDDTVRVTFKNVNI